MPAPPIQSPEQAAAGFEMEAEKIISRVVLLTDWNGKTRMLSTTVSTVHDLKILVANLCGIDVNDQMLSSPSAALSMSLLCDDGPFAPFDDAIPEIQVRPRCLGGKGGFGAMLRGQSSRPGMKQVTPNTGAMRDLSGRRLKHVEQEQKLLDWAAEAEKRKAEKELEKKEKRQKTWEETHKVAEDYVAEASIDAESVHEAVIGGLEESKKKKELMAAEEASKKLAVKEAVKKLDKLWGDDADGDSSSGDEKSSSSISIKKADTSGGKKEAMESQARKEGQEDASSKKQDVSASKQQQSSSISADSRAHKAAETVAATPATKVTQAKSEGDDKKGGSEQAAANLEDIDVDKVQSLQELDARAESMGGERLKFALNKRGLKCGGTPEQRAQRLWSVRGLARDKWPKNLLAPPQK